MATQSFYSCGVFEPVHRWWYRMLETAGIVATGVRAGLNMPRARHTFATDLRRIAGIEATSQALGHSDLNATLHLRTPGRQ